jgi:hypothetical protein
MAACGETALEFGFSPIKAIILTAKIRSPGAWDWDMRRRKFVALFCGAAVAWPLAAPAQRSTQGTATIGILAVAGITEISPAFVEALGKLGYQRARNLTVLFRSAKNTNAELPGLRQNW